MQPSPELMESIERERILRARRMSPADRVEEGLRQSELAFQVMRDGVRGDHPDADEAEVERILKNRLDRLRRLEEPR